MGDNELKRYPPTSRRLEQLRRAGRTPASRALGAVAATLVIAGLLRLWGPAVMAWLGSMLAQDLQQTSLQVRGTETLIAVLGLRLGQGVLAMLTVAGIGLMVRGAVHGAQSGKPAGSGSGIALPWSSRVAAGEAPHWRLVATVVGLAGLGLLTRGLLLRFAAGETADEMPWGLLCGQCLGLLAALAVLDAIVSHVTFHRGAAMSHRDLEEEQRQTGGPRLTRTRRRGNARGR